MESVAEGRFVVKRKLGAGANGSVFEVFDRERNASVALKTLRRLDATAIYRFKREFRALSDLAHPNLVKLFELASAGDNWFFTMECIDGVIFRDYVRPPVVSAAADDAAVDATVPTKPSTARELRVERLGDAFAQLCRGVAALHRAGRLHRDIKPTNILVSRADGRVVLCDFGLVTPSSADAPDRSLTAAGIVGTPSYMSPEQSRGRKVGEPSDWYSVGVVLYEVLTGHLPTSASGAEVSTSFFMEEPIPPVELDPAAPADLSALCCELLRVDPRERPTGKQVLERIGVEATAPELVEAGIADPPFIGRQAQLDALDRALDRARAGHAVVARLHGNSGMGKSAIVRRFTELVTAYEDTIVLQGRCFEQDSVPYKALDTVVDALTRHLMRVPHMEAIDLMPREVIALAKLFPVLRQVEAVAIPQFPVLEPPDPHESRRRAFGALRELLCRLSEGKVLVVCIDDLQWGDVDSVALLDEILRPPNAPRLLLVAVYRREEVEGSAFLSEFLASHPDAVDVPVDALSDDEANAMVRSLAGSRLSEQIVGEAGGNPFLLNELALYSMRSDPAETKPATVVEMLHHRLDNLPNAARRCLEAIAVAGRPIAQAVAKRAARVGEDPETPMVVLRSGHLVRSRGIRDDDVIETYHDRIREAVVARLDADALRRWHERLAIALEASGDADREALASHFYRAGNNERAAHYAVLAAEQAAAALAFDRAARLYQLAFELDPLDGRAGSQRRVRLAEALANAGRGAVSAREYLRAAEGAYVAEAIEYRRQAAEQLLRSGNIEEGLETLRHVLAALGLKLSRSPKRALLSLLLRRARVRMRGLGYTLRDPSQISSEEQGRIDSCWSVAAVLGMVDTVAGMDFQTRNTLLALRGGDRGRIARALSMEGIYVALDGYRTRKRSGRLMDVAWQLAEESGEANPRAQVRGGAALRSYQLGEFAEALDFAQRSSQLLNDHCTGVMWELDSASLISLWSLYYMGRVGEMARSLPELLRSAHERGDLFAATSFSVGLPNLRWVAGDDPDTGRDEATRAIERWSDLGFHLQHYWAWVSSVQTELYAGEFGRAWTMATETWPQLRRSLFLRIQAVKIESWHIRARAALRVERYKDADRAARRLLKEHLVWSKAVGHLVRGGVAAARGDDAAAVRHFDRGAALCDEADMAAYAAVARRRRGLLVGGDEGAQQVADAERTLQECGIANPARYAELIAP